jgi:NAD(P)-dependent dehydrogenase (short-subunit alcohol dehydrogenase family)
MRDHGGSVVVITAAPHDRVGDPGMSHTASARAGADNLCKTLSIEWAASQVRVNAVAPGSIYSETAEANYSDDKNFADASPTGPNSPRWCCHFCVLRAYDLVASSLCAAAPHPLYIRFAKIIGAPLHETTMRPNPTRAPINYILSVVLGIWK